MAVQGNQVDLRWEADCQVKTCAHGDAHATELAAWAAVTKKDSAHSPAEEAPQPASVGEASPKRQPRQHVDKQHGMYPPAPLREPHQSHKI